MSDEKVEEWPKLKKDAVNRLVRLKVQLYNGSHVFEIGEVMQVRKNHGGLTLRRMHTCPRCSNTYAVYISDVAPYMVDLLPLGYGEHKEKIVARPSLTQDQADAISIAYHCLAFNSDSMSDEMLAALATVVRAIEGEKRT